MKVSYLFLLPASHAFLLLPIYKDGEEFKSIQKTLNFTDIKEALETKASQYNA